MAVGHARGVFRRGRMSVDARAPRVPSQRGEIAGYIGDALLL